MKIYNDDHTFIIPSSKILIVNFNNYETEVINYLHTYFNLKRKTICRIVDDTSEDLNNKDTIFIDVSSINYISELSFKAKSTINEELCQFILNNPELFQSINTIRDNLYDLQTDQGMYKIKKILSKGINKDIEIKLDEFNVNLLMQMMTLNYSSFNKDEIKIVLLNLLMYINKDKNIILYFDEDIQPTLMQWILSTNEKTSIIINNTHLTTYNFKYNLLLLQNVNHLEKVNLEQEDIKTLTYLMHPLIINNPTQQNQEKLEFLYNYLDKNTSFFLF